MAPPPRAGKARKDEAAASRRVVLGWCLWLLGSWAVLLPMEGAVWAVRGMILAALVGLMVLWPLVRLSEAVIITPADAAAFPDRKPWPTWLVSVGVFVEWLSLIAVLQAVIWPLRITGDWSLAQALWLDAAVISWSLITAALIALGLQMNASSSRSVVMALCLLLFLGEWIVAAWLPVAGLGVSPLATVWSLTAPAAAVRHADVATPILAAAAAAVLAWVIVVVPKPR